MWSLWTITIILAVIAGLVVRYFINNDSGTYLQIDSKELLLGIFIIGPLIILAVTGIGWKMAFAEAVEFDEFYNGWELEAVANPETCVQDGSCDLVYQCDSYYVTEYYDDCDSDGNCTRKSRQVKKWHSCPYFTSETDYLIKDSLGQAPVIGENCVDEDLPRWTGSTDWTSNSHTPTCVGIPPFWQDAADRIDAGNPGYTSGRFSYDNFILASQNTILREYSAQIDYYRSQGLLPAPTYTLHTHYWSDKVYFIGCDGLVDETAWQHAVGYLNAALGTELQGDLHLIVSCDSRINLDPDTYLIAFKANAQDPEIYGDNVLSKNTVIAVVGSDDGGVTTSYGRATTGMPIGNNGLSLGIMSYFANDKIPFTPEAVVGTVRGEFYNRESDGKRKVRGTHLLGIGGFQDVLIGLSDETTIFGRISMSGGDADDIGTGFTYLAEEIRPSTSSQVWIVILAFIATLGMWFVFAQIGPSKRRMYRDFGSYRRY